MKKIAWMTAALSILAGCVYQAPLSEPQQIPIDRAVLGLWAQAPETNRTATAEERLLVLPYSETEYLIHYPTGKNGMYFRGYPIKVDDIACVQLELIGANDGLVSAKDRRYHVVAYTLADGNLEIKTLNTSLVGKDLKDRAALQAAFLKHKDNPALFTNPGTFRKVSKGE